MRIWITYLFVLFVLNGLSQTNELRKSITKGNWKIDYINFKRLDTTGHQVGDTVILYKVPKRLKLKKNSPLRFKKNGSVISAQVCSGCCGSVSTLESLWELKWQDHSTWQVDANHFRTHLIFGELILYLVDTGKNRFTFIYVAKQIPLQ